MGNPRAFVEVLQDIGRQADGSKFSGDIANGASRKRDLVWSLAGDLVGRRKIGKVASSKVGQIWGFDGTTL